MAIMLVVMESTGPAQRRGRPYKYPKWVRMEAVRRATETTETLSAIAADLGIGSYKTISYWLQKDSTSGEATQTGKPI